MPASYRSRFLSTMATAERAYRALFADLAAGIAADITRAADAACPQATCLARAHWLHRSHRAPARWSMSAFVCAGVGVMRRRSVFTGTVG